MNMPIADVIEKMFIVNHGIWELESDIRKGKEGELGIEEVGRRALEIRDLNRHRLELKNEINKRLDSDFYKIIKINHASAK